MPDKPTNITERRVSDRLIDKPDHDLGPRCQFEDCSYLAESVYASGPALCADHDREWLAEERYRLLQTLAQVEQDAAHFAFGWQDKRGVRRDFERIGRIAEEARRG